MKVCSLTCFYSDQSSFPKNHLFVCISLATQVYFRSPLLSRSGKGGRKGGRWREEGMEGGRRREEREGQRREEGRGREEGGAGGRDADHGDIIIRSTNTKLRFC